MVKRTRIWVWFMPVVLLLSPLAGCSGDDDDRPDGKNAEKAVEADSAVVGSFVGEVSGTEAFVAVVAAPAEGGKDSGTVQIYISDGRGVSESFSGPILDGGYVAQSDDGDAETEGKLSGESVTGTVQLPGGTTGSYDARPPSGGAGLYELTVSPGGELSGASAAGLAVKGEVTLERRGTGRLMMVDGSRLEFDLVRMRAGELAHLRAGQVRLIVLSDGELRGVAKARPSHGDSREFFFRSA
ncbi:MAG: hypothetical protein M3237_07605 [Actinomycetota bacterium]|nr:hypothetical protein [Actinomycetota bacterium]